MVPLCWSTTAQKEKGLSRVWGGEHLQNNTMYAGGGKSTPGEIPQQGGSFCIGQIGKKKLSQSGGGHPPRQGKGIEVIEGLFPNPKKKKV